MVPGYGPSVTMAPRTHVQVWALPSSGEGPHCVVGMDAEVVIETASGPAAGAARISFPPGVAVVTVGKWANMQVTRPQVAFAQLRRRTS